MAALNINHIICMCFVLSFFSCAKYLFFFIPKLNSVGSASGAKDAPGKKQRFSLFIYLKTEILHHLSLSWSAFIFKS